MTWTGGSGLGIDQNSWRQALSLERTWNCQGEDPWSGLEQHHDRCFGWSGTGKGATGLDQGKVDKRRLSVGLRRLPALQAWGQASSSCFVPA